MTADLVHIPVPNTDREITAAFGCSGCSDFACPGPPTSATIPPVVDRPEPPAFASVVEAPGTPDSSAPENSTTTSGAGADDQPTSRLLSDLALWLCRLQSRGPLSGSVFAAQVSPMLEAAFERAADFRDIEAAQREAAEAKAIAQQTEARLDAIEGKHDWFSAIAYAHLHQLPTSTQFLQRLGSCAARIGRSHGVEPTQVQHLWGWVNSWPAWVWDLAAEGFDR